MGIRDRGTGEIRMAWVFLHYHRGLPLEHEIKQIARHHGIDGTAKLVLSLTDS